MSFNLCNFVKKLGLCMSILLTLFLGLGSGALDIAICVSGRVTIYLANVDAILNSKI